MQLLVVSFISLLLLLLIQITETKVPKNRSDEMLRASQKMREAENVLHNYRSENNLEIDILNDPLQSGFIGIEFSPFTTTLGDLKAKQTSINPDFAALFVHWFDVLGLRQGNKVIIHTSSSFPALGIAAIIASEAFGLKPVIISSIGASSFGANIPELTYWDIENLLFNKKIINYKSTYSTLGGQNDNGSSFWEGGLDIAKQAAQRNSIRINYPQTFSEAIDQKMNFINSHAPVSLFINVGGNQSSMGMYPCSMQLTHGLITENIGSSDDRCFGLIHKINQLNIPVIHMLDIRDIALENGIGLLPNKDDILGKADIYYTFKNSKLLMIISLILLVMLTGIIVRVNYKKKRSKSLKN